MRITLSSRAVAVATVSAVILGGAGLLPSTAASAVRPSAAPVAGVVAADAAGVGARAAVRYWTPAKMSAVLQAATPATRDLRRTRPLVKRAAPAAAALWLTGNTAGDGLRWTHGGAVTAAVGKLFFTLGGSDYVCTGTLVGGGHPDVVLTAAHCVAGAPGRGRWATNWVFVPGYRDGRMPYGEYTARRFFIAPGWTGPEAGTEQYDVAFVQVNAATLDGTAGAAGPPRGLPIEFAGSQGAAAAGGGYVFGYPAEPPYTGLYANFCAGPVAAARGSVHARCGMTAGDSGGPWLAGFSPRSGTGRVFAVSTYKLSTNLRVLYGAVLGPQARAVYQRAVRTAG
jgi:V8-like Glu-specific endopeptidase